MKEWSGRQDLNLRPLRPERNALAKLSYAPMGSRMRLNQPDLDRSSRSPPARARGHLVPVALGLSIAGSGGGVISPGPTYFKRSRAISSTT